MVDVGRGDRLEHLRMGAGVVVGGEAARIRARSGAHGCSSRALAVHPAGGVGAEVGQGVGDRLRRGERRVLLVRVPLPHRRRQDRVDDDDVGGRRRPLERIRERERPCLRRRLRRRIGGVRPARCLRLGRGDEREAAVAALRQGAVEGARRVLERPHEQVVEPLVVVHVEALDRIAAAPAADEMERGRRPSRNARRASPVQATAESASSRSTACMSSRSSGMPSPPTAASIRSHPDVRERERRAVGREALDHRGPEAAADARDRDHAAVEIAHQRAAPSAAVGCREGLPSSAGCSFGASCV